jgi:probable rRNA maturation factor
VLSFAYSKQEGEIVLCSEIIRENAKKFNSTFKKELKRVLIHGVLHFFGYSHEEFKVKAKKMQEKENYYSNLCQKII